jgi:hypothetical protein
VMDKGCFAAVVRVLAIALLCGYVLLDVVS